ncbi:MULTISPECIES: Sec-independent protein translocase subunit TatA [Thermomonosporaceae]|uniref:Sec-independent protein translocase subunit TatA n=1 Tax=Thermomonosporaceae TaxID=2012 RepID=UPI00255A74EF|nr:MULTISPECIES: Sec-independent protein translocase subunit TatA [Thermomonosporaceae]MDL4777007.1 Sec-independent protein translocase subunit TatA [Actinomadura xylanilytica]
MGNFGTGEILIILAVVLLLFGSTKLPQLARSLGKSARILKAETKGLRDDDEGETAAKPAAAPEPAAAAQPVPQQEADARERAARLREEAARLEREAAVAEQGPRRQGALASGEPIQGVPVSDPSQVRKP